MIPMLPETVQAAVSFLVERLQPERVTLFGSQARGDAKSFSDWDIAVDHPTATVAQWSRFLADFEDANLTLRPIDFVWLTEASAAMKSDIRSEGVVLYAKPKVN